LRPASSPQESWCSPSIIKATPPRRSSRHPSTRP
jgi:hypothetical protein